jgi:hypothetical protein
MKPHSIPFQSRQKGNLNGFLSLESMMFGFEVKEKKSDHNNNPEIK